MLKLRIIPILSFNGFALVKTKQFQSPRMVGNPVQAARVYNARGVDELIFVDIMASKNRRPMPLPIIKDVLKECLMPVSVGGGIQSIEDISELFRIGADKVVIKTAAIHNQDLVRRAIDIFGAQAICVAVDARKEESRYVIHHFTESTIPVETFIDQMNAVGVGELMVTAVDHDGMMGGFDLELAKLVRPLTELPLIFAGGAGGPEHYAELFGQVAVDAAAAASIFHFTQYTPHDIKARLQQDNHPVRFQSQWTHLARS